VIWVTIPAHRTPAGSRSPGAPCATKRRKSLREPRRPRPDVTAS